MWEKTSRNPLFLFLLFGLFLLRTAARMFLSLLLKEPPRSTRAAQGRIPRKQSGLSALRMRNFEPSAQQTTNFIYQFCGMAVLSGS